MSTAFVDEFCSAIKARYPAISAKADAEYERLWGGFSDSEYFSSLWFEALANVLNHEMSAAVHVATHQDLFTMIGLSFESGDETVRNCIDVSFVENLFWQVSDVGSIATYWAALPDNLRRLYLDFHGRDPL